MTWVNMHQDETESPSYFSQVLKADLTGVPFPDESTRLQYVNDLPLGSPSRRHVNR